MRKFKIDDDIKYSIECFIAVLVGLAIIITVINFYNNIFKTI
jgi:hypothetical protein